MSFKSANHVLQLFCKCQGNACHQNEIRNLKPVDFTKAALEERAHKPFSNPVMKALCWNLSSICAKVMGTDESHIKIRSLVWGMCVKINLPSIWLTLNPADTQDPIMQVLCRMEIDLDNFNVRNHQLSDVHIAADPYASATYFHLIVNTAVLEKLLSIQGYKHKQKIICETGILGIVEGYIGTVEAQGRGFLHLHILLWLRGSPSSDIMKEWLQDEDFRSKMQAFISKNISADLDRLSASDILSIPVQPNVAFLVQWILVSQTTWSFAEQLRRKLCTLYKFISAVLPA